MADHETYMRRAIEEAHVKIQAGSTMDLKASATLNAKGATINLN